MAKKKEVEARVVEAENKMYELMLVLKPDMLESSLKKKLKDLTKYAEEHGCKITNEDIWEKRRLAYRIKQYDEGNYVVYNFEGPTTFIAALDNHLRIDNDIIRHLLISIASDYQYARFDEEEDVEEEKTEKKEKPAPKAVVKKEESKKEDVKEEPKEEVEEKKEPKEEKKEVEADEKAVEEAEKKVEKAEEKLEEVEEKAEEKKEDKEEPKEEKKGLLSKLIRKTKKEVKEEEKKEEPKEDKEEEVNKSDLDDKLDKLLGGDDLNI